jgi:hypothetical protein
LPKFRNSGGYLCHGPSSGRGNCKKHRSPADEKFQVMLGQRNAHGRWRPGPLEGLARAAPERFARSLGNAWPAACTIVCFFFPKSRLEKWEISRRPLSLAADALAVAKPAKAQLRPPRSSRTGGSEEGTRDRIRGPLKWDSVPLAGSRRIPQVRYGDLFIREVNLLPVNKGNEGHGFGKRTRGSGTRMETTGQ